MDKWKNQLDRDLSKTVENSLSTVLNQDVDLNELLEPPKTRLVDPETEYKFILIEDEEQQDLSDWQKTHEEIQALSKTEEKEPEIENETSLVKRNNPIDYVKNYFTSKEWEELLDKRITARVDSVCRQMANTYLKELKVKETQYFVKHEPQMSRAIAGTRRPLQKKAFGAKVDSVQQIIERLQDKLHEKEKAINLLQRQQKKPIRGYMLSTRAAREKASFPFALV